MILADTSVWIDHIRSPDPVLSELLAAGQVRMHPAVVGEVALGSIAGRERIIANMAALPHVLEAEDFEVMQLVERHSLHGRGIGWVDAHLATSALLSNVRLLTRDRRLAAVADELGIAANL